MENIVELGVVVVLSWDCMSGDIGTCKKPVWSDIEKRIRALITPEYSSVFLQASNGNLLTVAGDVQHGFLTYLTDHLGDHHYVMVPPNKRRGKTSITIGFQPGDYANRILVSIETALAVAHIFFKREMWQVVTNGRVTILPLINWDRGRPTL